MNKKSSIRLLDPVMPALIAIILLMITGPFIPGDIIIRSIVFIGIMIFSVLLTIFTPLGGTTNDD